MKRYNLEETGQPFESDRQMVEDPGGEYVKWEDVRSLWGTILNMTSSQLANWMDSMSYKRKIKREG